MSILLQDLTKRFGEHLVVSRVTLEIQDGELFVLLGSSGSGKSTILRMISGLSAPDAGRIILNGRDVTDLPPQKRGTGFVFQNYSNFRHMNAAENIEFGLRIRKVPAPERRRRSDELLDLVGMSGLGARLPDQLSGGQQQRVAIARALAYQPSVLLLDEPFGALDVKIRAQLRESLKEVQRRLRVTTILVTHDQEEAFELADRIGIIERGRLVEVGTPEALYFRPRSEYSATFIGGGNVLVGRVEQSRIRLGTTSWPLRPEDPAHDEGAPVRVLFRPEAVVLRDAPFAANEPVHFLARGRVRDRLFSGSLQRIRIDVDGLQGVRPLTPPPAYGQRTTQIEAVHPSDPEREAPGAEPELWIGVRQYHVLEPGGLRMLICQDPARPAEAVAEYGCRLAQEAGGPATLLAVVADRSGDAPARERLEAIARRWSGHAPHLQAKVRQGAPAATEILLESQEANDEMIVLGRSDSDPDAETLGSTARAILDASEIPVLLVRPMSPAVRRILICTAAGEPGKADVLFGGRLARRTGASVSVFHAAPPHASGRELDRARRHLTEAQASLEQLGVSVSVSLSTGMSVVDAVLQQIEKGACDLLVLGAASPADRLRLRAPDLVTQILRGAPCSVLIVPMH